MIRSSILDPPRRDRPTEAGTRALASFEASPAGAGVPSSSDLRSAARNAASVHRARGSAPVDLYRPPAGRGAPEGP